jgi:hypothetical protein
MVLFLALTSSVSFAVDDDDNKRLEAFLGKVEKFYKNKDRQTTNWRMPNSNPESNMETMPNTNIDFYDNNSGLEYSPSRGKIFDPELNIELDMVTGIIYDFKTEKEYSLSELRSKEKEKAASAEQ